MKHFSLSSGMTTMRGVFYPRGHIVLMFPTEQDVLMAADLLRQDGVSEDDLSVATPEEFEREIKGLCQDHPDVLLPSVGTEAETAQHLRRLAHQGHHALIVHAGAKLTSHHVVELLKDTHCSYGQRYRFLVIEDLVC
ncbi:RNA-binding protein [Ramlibacter sp. AW1]|uniref:RNA-binding protein n=1 Tax=Ramlibacter aurantiacus TaxID=2801330 RepID=A0A936ZPG8_9BURK|nr:RNA-binding protein [Ramlibacter aurantiacus]MBL0421120.1 RNA-binding protein [Ramlibacter aurantiacus]